MARGSRPAARAASSMARPPRLEVLKRPVGEGRGDPAVGLAPDQLEHAGAVGADPDPDGVGRCRAGVHAVELVVAAVVAQAPLAAPHQPDDVDGLLGGLEGLGRGPPA